MLCWLRFRNRGSGTLDLQQHRGGSFSASQIVGAYSFTMTRTAQTNPATKVSFGGMFTLDGVATMANGSMLETAALNSSVINDLADDRGMSACALTGKPRRFHSPLRTGGIRSRLK